jgi:hypothetical protein
MLSPVFSFPSVIVFPLPSFIIIPALTVIHFHSLLPQDVEVEPHNPHLFWSASEDGTVRQFDVRCR